MDVGVYTYVCPLDINQHTQNTLYRTEKTLLTVFFYVHIKKRHKEVGLTPVTEVGGDNKQVLGVGQVGCEECTIQLLPLSGQGPDQDGHHCVVPFTTGKVE